MNHWKRFTYICISIIFIFSLTGCGGYNDPEENLISEADFMECIQTVEITADNWSDYFQLSEEESYEEDSFGEQTGEYSKGIAITPAEKYMNGYFSVEADNYVVLRFAWEERYNWRLIGENGENLGNVTGFPDEEEFSAEERDFEIYDSSFSDDTSRIILSTYDYLPRAENDINEVDGKKVIAEAVEREYQNLSCMKAKGTVIVAEIPKEYWTKAHADSHAELGKEQDYIAVKGEDGIITYYYADGCSMGDSEGFLSRTSGQDYSAYHSQWDLSYRKK